MGRTTHSCLWKARVPPGRAKSRAPAADRDLVDPTVVMEGGAMGAAAIGFARKRPRKQRVRREPIDLERLAAEFADAPVTVPSGRSEYDIIRALEAEVERVNATQPEPEVIEEVEEIDPFGIASDSDDQIAVSRDPEPSPALPTDGGL